MYSRSPCLTLWLTVGVVNVNVHGSMQGVDQRAFVGSLGLMSSVDGLGLPVGPVDVLLKQRHGKDVRDVLAKNCEGTHTHTQTRPKYFR